MDKYMIMPLEGEREESFGVRTAELQVPHIPTRKQKEAGARTSDVS